ncbi:MAG: Lrp/AsnC family transcriptional regulator [Candidatus Bathyarchaeum sp.]|nr:MAG: Lrp/AsnC family transcriptional regulator [Candidatus Bathyarchaeum sp.]
MDKIDLLILRELLKDAQTPFLRIAKKLGVSPETVRKRYNRMKEERTIRHCSVSIDLSKLGYQGKVFLMITNAPSHDKSKTIAALEKMRHVFIASEMIGDFEIIGIAPVKDLDSLKNLVNKIKKEPSVNQVEIALINDTAFPINPRADELFVQSITNSTKS